MTRGGHIDLRQEHPLLNQFAFTDQLSMHVFSSGTSQGPEQTILHCNGCHELTPHLLHGRRLGGSIRLLRLRGLLAAQLVKKFLDEPFLLRRREVTLFRSASFLPDRKSVV